VSWESRHWCSAAMLGIIRNKRYSQKSLPSMRSGVWMAVLYLWFVESCCVPRMIIVVFHSDQCSASTGLHQGMLHFLNITLHMTRRSSSFFICESDETWLFQSFWESDKACPEQLKMNGHFVWLTYMDLTRFLHFGILSYENYMEQSVWTLQKE
jgi:hypothetical protein